MIEKAAILLNNAIIATEEHGHKAAEHVKDTLHAVGEHAKDAAHHAGDTLHSVAGHAHDAAHHAAEHGGGHGHHPELPNWIELVHLAFPGPVTDFLWHWHVPIFSMTAMIFLAFFCIRVYTKRTIIPGPLQNFIEFCVEGLYNLVIGIMGESGKRYVPFLGTLFVFIFVQNLMGLVPGGLSPTAKLNTTLAMASCVFLYVQFEGIRVQGFLGYLHHLAGSPRSAVEWALVPLNLPLHIIGEFAKPISLALRLFGNISGEDMLLAIFVGLGILLSSTFIPNIAQQFLPGIPLQLPFILLALLLSFVQALVFTMLSTIYFSLMTHHEEEEHH